MISRRYTYTYDNLGNITQVSRDGTVQASYAYDDLGQLVRENNKAANKTYVYTYDDRGNILSRKTYAYTTGSLGAVQATDSYGYYQQYDTELWGDVLKSYNGTSFTYDEIGNPLTYYNGSSYTFSWMQGRKLIDGTKGSTRFSYGYNSDGLRTSKTVGNQTYTYYWNGTQLAAMTVSSSGTVTVTMCFYYNADGTPLYFTYNGTEYFYVTNLQGDVVGIANSNGIVGYYEYDAWGKILSYSGIGSTDYSAITYNPLRYRGYIYDNETGFYYLQSRYYDPSIRRFINADDASYLGVTGTLTSYNLFAYCENYPVDWSDPSGHFVLEATIFSGIVKLAATFIACATIATAIPPAVKSAKKGISDLIDEVTELVDELTIDAVVDTDTAELPKQEPIYYGAHVYGGKPWKKTTGPMTMDQATIWIYLTAASNRYGRGASWGVYTAEEVDAYAMAVRIRNGNPIQHFKSGCYPHYHIKDRDFGRYKHFHIWYGEILP